MTCPARILVVGSSGSGKMQRCRGLMFEMQEGYYETLDGERYDIEWVPSDQAAIERERLGIQLSDFWGACSTGAGVTCTSTLWAHKTS